MKKADWYKRYLNQREDLQVSTQVEPRLLNEDKMLDFISQEITKAEKEELEFLKRIKLELDVGVCQCGEKWKETDLAILVNERLRKITNYLERKK